MHFTLTDLAADITQNGAESGASLLRLEIREIRRPDGEEFRFTAADNGGGMSGAGLDRAMDPFVTDGVKHPGRRVGLGIPFLIQTALQSGGGWRIRSVRDGRAETRSGGPGAGRGSAGDDAEAGAGPESGTVSEAWFDLSNVDTPPVGDIPGLFRSVLLFEGPEEIILKRSRKGGDGDLDYEVKKSELEEALGGLEDVSSLALLGKYLRSLEGEDEE
ncbi:MAG: ATP-binding protein [Treponema sp.]|nr:ATP-binding protein [Treponema sp.]